MADSNLFSETFTVSKTDQLKYERVLRIFAESDSAEVSLSLDINSELFPCSQGERLHLLCASTLAIDGSKDDGKGWKDAGQGEASLADEYDYVCHGKVYRIEEGKDDHMKVFVSFGGLLFFVNGPYKILSQLRQEYIYLLLKR